MRSGISLDHLNESVISIPGARLQGLDSLSYIFVLFDESIQLFSQSLLTDLQ
jgi:hypothetical protein